MSKTALIVVDVQNDFLPPGGSLAVPGGREVVPVIRRLLADHEWDVVVASQDYHPPDHISFARNHPGGAEFSEVQKVGARGEAYTQTLWPAHCVVGSEGVEIDAELRPDLDRLGERCVLVRKGWHRGIEAYSAFAGYVTPAAEPTGPPPTLPAADASELTSYLRARGVSRVVVVGLAGDYCVSATAVSAAEYGFQTAVLLAGTRSIAAEKAEGCWDRLRGMGADIIPTQEWEDGLKSWLQ